MTIREDELLELPFQNLPGRCPKCGHDVRPAADRLFPLGTWSGVNEASRERTGGFTLATNCQDCGVVLQTYCTGLPSEIESASIIWHTHGNMTLIGGDRWRGCPNAWSPYDATRHEGKLRELQVRYNSLDKAIQILHLTSGLGAITLSLIVQQATELSSEQSRLIVTQALASMYC